MGKFSFLKKKFTCKKLCRKISVQLELENIQSGSRTTVTPVEKWNRTTGILPVRSRYGRGAVMVRSSCASGSVRFVNFSTGDTVRNQKLLFQLPNPFSKQGFKQAFTGKIRIYRHLHCSNKTIKRRICRVSGLQTWIPQRSHCISE